MTARDEDWAPWESDATSSSLRPAAGEDLDDIDFENLANTEFPETQDTDDELAFETEEADAEAPQLALTFEGADDMEGVFERAVALCLARDACSVSLLQRQMQLDFSTAAGCIERMEAEGLVGPYRGTGHREVLVTPEDWADRRGTR